MITVNGPRVVSRAVVGDSVCFTVSGIGGNMRVRLIDPPSGARVSITGNDPPEFCVHLPPGFLGGIEFRIGGANGVTRDGVIVRP